ncbi:MAG TPA: FAD-dependent oxidoreductase, partial [Candidatus Saccharimonadales bacterium]|nr:FAD-dependent oxidoreductase [Candidatus Saccharimonadales bacterium]
MAELPGKDTSLWLDTTSPTDYPKYQPSDEVFDAIIAGGGIAGILTAWHLRQAGLNVALLEKNKIIENTTGNTTAKLTSQHNLIYDFLIKKHGKEAAQAFADVNQQAIGEIKQLAEELCIDCDYEPGDAYVYTEKEEKLEDIQSEVEAAKSLGLPASFETNIELPIEIEGAIKFADQAQFHPRKFLLGVADNLVKNGLKIYEQTEVKDIEPGSPAILKTANGDIKAKYIVGATKYPFWRSEIFEDATWTKLSYALGVKLKGDYPKNMYITTERPVRSIRSHPYKGSRLLVFGGESHEMTKDYDKNEHYQNLIDDVTKRFEVDEILYRWIAG